MPGFAPSFSTPAARRPTTPASTALLCSTCSITAIRVHLFSSHFTALGSNDCAQPCRAFRNLKHSLCLLRTDPDITRGDGVYSRYFGRYFRGAGTYTVTLSVDAMDGRAYTIRSSANPNPSGESFLSSPFSRDKH